MVDFLRAQITELGSFVAGFISLIGQLSILCVQVVYWGIRGEKKHRLTLEQFNEIGVNSLPMVAIASLFTGMVLVVQVGKQFVNLKAEEFIGGTVALSLARELAPMLTAVVVAGRNGSAIAAEIGTMKVSEQIDALTVMATNPISYLVVPRALACMLILPCLTVFSNFVGIAGGALVAITQVHISYEVFEKSVLTWVSFEDIASGLVKAFVFGVIIAIVACYKGLTTRGGAAGVGRATTGSVVMIITLLLIANYFLSLMFFTYIESFSKTT